MNRLIYALLMAFKSITRYKVASTALISGVAILFMWIGVSFLLWHPLTSLTSKLLEFVPFALIKSNGAWMLSSLLFVQVVFITLAFFIIILSSTIVKDAKEGKYTIYLFTLAFAVILFWSAVWFFNSTTIYSALTRLLTWLPFETIEKGIAYIFAAYLIYAFYVVSLLIYVSLFSEKIINSVSRVDISKVSEIKVIGYTLKDAFIFLVVSVVAFPILFIPVLNFFAQIFVWIWLIKDTFTYDIGAIFFKEDRLRELKKEHKSAILSISFASSLFNFVPILNIFAPYFGEFALYHYFESLKDDM